MIQPIRTRINRYKNLKRLKSDFDKYNSLNNILVNKRFSPSWSERGLVYEDTASTHFDTHYVYHPAWAARVLAKVRPKLHIDISSTLYFSTMVSAFVPTKFYDYRPAPLKELPGLECDRADLTKLPFKDNTVESISCMHTIEHIGLGRYGDPIDPEADLKSIRELQRVTAMNGDIIFVVPIGKSKLVFNAHRIYSYSQVMEYFKDFKLEEFFLIPDNAFEKGPIVNATEKDADAQNYGCGCFWFKKIK